MDGRGKPGSIYEINNIVYRDDPGAKATGDRGSSTPGADVNIMGGNEVGPGE